MAAVKKRKGKKKAVRETKTKSTKSKKVITGFEYVDAYKGKRGTKKTALTLRTLEDESDVLDGVIEYVQTPFPWLDYIISGGKGIATGKVTQFFGGEGAGKSALSQILMKTFLDLGGVVLFIDFEEAINVVHIRGYGIDIKTVLYEDPDHIEAGFDVVDELLLRLTNNPPKGPSLIIWDSVAGAGAMSGFDALQTENAQPGAVSRAYTKGTKHLRKKLKRARCAMIMINQLRKKIGIRFGDPNELAGGHHLKHATDTVCKFSKISTLRNTRNGVRRANGFVCKIDTNRKNRLAPPGQSCEIVVSYTGSVKGPNPAKSALHALKSFGLATVSGGDICVKFPDDKFNCPLTAWYSEYPTISDDIRELMYTHLSENLGEDED